MNDRPTKEFVCHYHHDGAKWGLNIHAYDLADAEARVKKLGFLKLDGELVMTIHGQKGRIVPFICWIRNAWKALTHAAIILFALCLAGCVSNPYVTVETPDGTKTTYSTGKNLMAEVDEQVSEVQGGGYHLRHMVKRQDATKVPLSAIRTAGTIAFSYIAYLDRLAEQVTSRVLAGEITKREGAAALAKIESERIAAQSGAVGTAAEHGAEFTPITVTPP